MQRISSSATFLHKRIFPITWFGGVLAFMVFGGHEMLRSPGVQSLPFLLIPAAMLVVGYVIMRLLVFDLVDEVLDAGDALLIRNGSEQEQVPLADIVNVSYSQFVNPPRVTLSLRHPGVFG